MDNVFDMHDFIGTSQGDEAHMLGKFLYFSLANLLVDKEDLSKLCEDMGIPYAGGTRLSVGDAFLVVGRHPEYFWSEVTAYLKSTNEFEVRFGVVMLLNYYVNNRYVEQVLGRSEDVV